MRSATTTSEIFQNERDSSERLIVRQTNWGEPYQDGVQFDLHSDRDDVTVSLTEYEIRRLHDFLGRLLASGLR